MLQCTQGTMLKIAKLHRPEEHPLKRGWNRLIFAKFKVRRLHKKFLGTNALMHPGNNLKKGQAAILSISYITTCIVKTYTSVAKIPRVPVENQITTLGVVKIAIKFSPCSRREKPKYNRIITRFLEDFTNGNNPISVHRLFNLIREVSDDRSFRIYPLKVSVYLCQAAELHSSNIA